MPTDFLTLTEALAIRPRSVVALVGGGGKTSTLLRLCQESAHEGRRVLATTTARMKMEELTGMRDVLLWDDKDVSGQTWRSCRTRAGGSTSWIDEVLAGETDATRVPVTFLGRSVMRDKVIGLPADHLGDLLARLKWDVVVVEADGSRGHSVKGHRLGEPIIPLCATVCVIVIGADGFGASVNADHCHRPEVIQELLGVGWGERLSARLIVELICHPRGLLNKIPGDIAVAIYVNKAPLGRNMDCAREFAEQVLKRCGTRVQRVAVGDNLQGGLVETFGVEIGTR
jgi:probable selenium-dependent hydroxylase accessory protein YqeC